MEERLGASKTVTIRLIALLKTMTQTSGTTAYFANLLNVDERTFRRDVRLLRNAGFPIIFDRESRHWELVSDYGVPAIELNEREALAAVFLFQEFGNQVETPLFSLLRSAAIKLISNLPSKLLDYIDLVGPKMTTRVGPIDEEKYVFEDDRWIDGRERCVNESDRKKRWTVIERKFELILEASVERKTLEVRYKGPGQPEFETTLHAYATFFSRAWYVVGYSSLHREIRTFKTSRFTKIGPSESPFHENKSFSLDAYFGAAWRFIREPRIYRVVVRFSPKVGANVAEVRWHKSQKTQLFPDGGALLEFEVAGLNEIVWWILGYGPKPRRSNPLNCAPRFENRPDASSKFIATSRKKEKNEKK